MTQAMEDDSDGKPIRLALRRHGLRTVCHMTPCHKLPSIFLHRGILSYRERRRRGLQEEPDSHYWGAEGKKEALEDFVICAFQTPWGMLKDHVEEMALILLDAEAVCSIPGVCFSPVNTAENVLTPSEVKARMGADALEACFPKRNYPDAGTTEILIPEQIPIRMYYALAMCDDIARDYWVPKLVRLTDDDRHAVAAHRPKPGLQRGFGFPPEWNPSRRIR